MHRCLSLALLLLFGSLLGAGSAFAEPKAGSRPNVVLMMTDDQGYGQMGAHGHPWIDTPNLDALFAKSTRFDRFLVSPTCSPTRAALMSGRHPLKNGITHTILERERMALSTVTIAEVLQKAGYQTGIFGKWHLGDEEEYQPRNRGFGEEFIHGAGGIGQAYACSCADAPGNKYFDPVLRHNGTFVKTEGYCTDLFFTAALGWIQEQKQSDEPFFAYLTTNAPHGPFIAPESNTKKFQELGFGKTQAGFYGMIENIDENMGRLVAHLEAWGLMENTLLIFMSDNGTTGNGSGRGRIGTLPDGTEMNLFNAGMKGMKGSADEGGVRVPFLARWDGVLAPGRTVDALSAHIDLFPTLAELAAAPLPPNQVEGRSLLPLLVDPEAEWADRFLFTQIARWPTGQEPDDHAWKRFAVRNSQYRLVGDALFDMNQDPGQTTNLAESKPEVVAEMRRAYEKFWKEARPLMVNEDAPMSPTRPYHVDFKMQSEADGIADWTPPVIAK